MLHMNTYEHSFPTFQFWLWGESGCNVNRDEYKESKNHVRSLVENEIFLSWQHSSLDYVHVAKTLSNTEC